MKCDFCEHQFYQELYGQHGAADCPLRRELKMLSTKDGKEQLRREYHSEIKKSGTFRGGNQ